jgi:hypothetical protein
VGNNMCVEKFPLVLMGSKRSVKCAQTINQIYSVGTDCVYQVFVQSGSEGLGELCLASRAI